MVLVNIYLNLFICITGFNIRISIKNGSTLSKFSIIAISRHRILIQRAFNRLPLKLVFKKNLIKTFLPFLILIHSEFAIVYFKVIIFTCTPGLQKHPSFFFSCFSIYRLFELPFHVLYMCFLFILSLHTC